MTVRQQIADLLKRAPSLRQVEKDTGIDIAVLSKIANSKRQPSGDVIDRLAKYFKHELRPIKKR